MGRLKKICKKADILLCKGLEWRASEGGREMIDYYTVKSAHNNISAIIGI